MAWLGFVECLHFYRQCAVCYVRSLILLLIGDLLSTYHMQGTLPTNGDTYGDKAGITLSSWSLQDNRLSITIAHPYHNCARCGQVLKTKVTQPNTYPFQVKVKEKKVILVS